MKRINLIIFCMVFVCIEIAGQVRLINLGNDCEPAWNLSFYNLRKEAFPLDWLSTRDFEGLIKLIYDDFKFFLDPKYLIWDGDKIRNTYYNLNFVHDFPTEKTRTINENTDVTDSDQLILKNFLDFLPIVKIKYERRIERFYTALKSNDKIVFFRTHITPGQAKNFVKLMKNRFPYTNYLLVVVHNNEKFNYNWDILKVNSFYSAKNTANKSLLQSWFDHNLWKSIFFSLGINQN